MHATIVSSENCCTTSVCYCRGFQPLSRCGPHRNSKLGWRTPRPKAHQLQAFVLLVGPEHVLLRLCTQTTWILLNAKLRAQHLKAIAHTEITSVSKIKQSPKIFTSSMFIRPPIQCSVQWEGCACFTLQSLSKRGGMRCSLYLQHWVHVSTTEASSEWTCCPSVETLVDCTATDKLTTIKRKTQQNSTTTNKR